MDYPAQRREQIVRFLHEKDLDGFLVSHGVNVTYLTGFSGDSSYLLVGRDRLLLVTDGRYTQQLSEECPGLPLHVRPPAVRLPAATIEALGKLGWRKIGFEAAHLTVGEFTKYKEGLPAADWCPCEETVENLRMRKDPSEIAQIREAIGFAERAFERFRRSLGSSDTEKQLGDRIEMMVREAGGHCTSFPPIVGVGERSALPHAPLGDRRLDSGEFVLVDWGASGRFYKSDLTRVIPTHSISPKLEELHEVVLCAQRRAIAKVRPGVKGHEVDAEARAALEEAGFGQFFNHGLGHGFGLEIHEGPSLRPNSDHVLEPGMVCTIEPGVYLPDWGGVRLEDDLLVTPDGCEVLTSVTKDLRVLSCEF